MADMLQALVAEVKKLSGKTHACHAYRGGHSEAG